ncbi:hypothetical protein BDK51DRAFT_42330 [Blyttiomyces helicus]|uniref:Uncharacterized protein n=1 Tax=Blyttiomyces helicus TaxID=388810 RepID=A0A4P9WN58_9FUNG|nr:hypothetical protein BDK51DRAFT_42330 [Blyttiomyces helicus]|eukprot:RKO93493.1 hypothetical protein BDK51DRAFT_42330 [Blyttiomyces helicus]
MRNSPIACPTRRPNSKGSSPSTIGSTSSNSNTPPPTTPPPPPPSSNLIPAYVILLGPHQARPHLWFTVLTTSHPPNDLLRFAYAAVRAAMFGSTLQPVDARFGVSAGDAALLFELYLEWLRSVRRMIVPELRDARSARDRAHFGGNIPYAPEGIAPHGDPPDENGQGVLSAGTGLSETNGVTTRSGGFQGATPPHGRPVGQVVIRSIVFCLPEALDASHQCRVRSGGAA